MKGGDGGCEVFLSLGRNSSSSSEAAAAGGVTGFDDSSLPHMLSSLSRNGLSMLAGGASQISSLRSSSNLAQPSGGKVCGGGFTGFYRTTRTHGASSSENHAHNKASVRSTSIAAPAPVNATVKPDVENLSPDECWRLILKLGSRWPAWNGALASSPQVPQDRNLEVEQDSLKVIASRALEALAQRPDRHSRPMLAPQKRTSTQEATPILKPILEEPVSRELATPSKAVVSSTETRTETRTAPLTIFYAGTVNVCNDVPEDKARLIMLFAEKARVPPRDVSPECILTEEDTEVAPSASAAAALEDVPESSPMSVKITISEGGKSRRQQGAAKPLPNARKNTLARFLDTRKRPSAAGSEGQKLSKKLSLGSDGCISDGDDMKSPKQLCSLSSWDSRDGMRYNIMDAEMT